MRSWVILRQEYCLCRLHKVREILRASSRIDPVAGSTVGTCYPTRLVEHLPVGGWVSEERRPRRIKDGRVGVTPYPRPRTYPLIVRGVTPDTTGDIAKKIDIRLDALIHVSPGKLQRKKPLHVIRFVKRYERPFAVHVAILKVQRDSRTRASRQ